MISKQSTSKCYFIAEKQGHLRFGLNAFLTSSLGDGDLVGDDFTF